METNTHLTHQIDEALRETGGIAAKLGRSEQEAYEALASLFSMAKQNELLANLYLAETYHIPVRMLKARYEGKLARLKREPKESNPYPSALVQSDPIIRVERSEWASGWDDADNEWHGRTEKQRQRYHSFRPAILATESFQRDAENLRNMFPNFDDVMSMAIGQICSGGQNPPDPPPFTLESYKKIGEQVKASKEFYTMPVSENLTLSGTYRHQGDFILLESIRVGK